MTTNAKHRRIAICDACKCHINYCDCVNKDKHDFKAWNELRSNYYKNKSTAKKLYKAWSEE